MNFKMLIRNPVLYLYAIYILKQNYVNKEILRMKGDNHGK